MKELIPTKMYGTRYSAISDIYVIAILMKSLIQIEEGLAIYTCPVKTDRKLIWLNKLNKLIKLYIVQKKKTN